MRFQEMESHLAEAKRALDAATDPDKAVVLAPVAIAHSLLVLAECAYRRESRES